ncbi:MAG: septal ring lytic transglycosylase RlpA family protein [Rickettsiales bacterium]|jgi:rare lipoprotein A|nr:septal ring lytic transglycosylase RlpA family protein [Rickettsiales bacterium]
MNMKFIPVMVLSLAVAGCWDSGNIGEYGSTDAMLVEEPLDAVYVAEPAADSHVMAPAPKYYIGTPYQIDGVKYTPAEDMAYNMTGMGGIIPTSVNGTATVDGEVYDSEQLVAAHKTLQLPSVARVTNLENGQSVVVRVNNRGPFVNNRIMDVSAAAARKLGMSGPTKIQVAVLPDESTAVKAATLGETVTTTTTTTAVVQPVVATTGTGEYAVQLIAVYSEDSAQSTAANMSKYGATTIVQEGGMFKVRIAGLDAAGAKSLIETLRSAESMSPGLLHNGRWVNPDSI